MCGKAHPEHRTEDDLEPVGRDEGAVLDRRSPTGACIQLLLAMIQNAESVVPSATIAVENR